jgi:hypothetical protein
MAPTVAPPHEPTRRQKEILRVEEMKQEEKALQAEFVAKREARQAATAATNQAYREKRARERDMELKEKAERNAMRALTPSYSPEPDAKAENAERNAIYDLAGDDDRALKAGPKTKVPKTGSKSKAPKTKAPKAGPKTGPKSKAPYTGPFSNAPYTRPELGERSPSGSPPPTPNALLFLNKTEETCGYTPRTHSL